MKKSPAKDDFFITATFGRSHHSAPLVHHSASLLASLIGLPHHSAAKQRHHLHHSTYSEFSRQKYTTYSQSCLLLLPAYFLNRWRGNGKIEKINETTWRKTQATACVFFLMKMSGEELKKTQAEKRRNDFYN